MFENLCTLPLSSDLFAQAIHPSEPLFTVGLSNGHVQTFKLPSVDDEEEEGDDDATSVKSGSSSSRGTGTIETVWRTRRHKGSCRSLGYSYDGNVLYSAGTDALLKAAITETGRVVSKIYVPQHNDSIDPPTLLHALSPQTLLLATDSGALHLLDLRENNALSSKPAQTHFPHDDYVSSLTPLPPSEASTSGFSKQWITTGGTRLAVTDLRRGVLVKSEDQEEELLSSVYVTGLRARPGGSKGEKAVIGSSGGVLTLWEKGVWDDQDERIVVDGSGKGGSGGESLDVMSLVPEEVMLGGKGVAVGVGDGTVRIVEVGRNKVVSELRHDDIEGVVGLGFDCMGRMISGGGSVVKVWQEISTRDQEDEEEEEAEDDSDDEVDIGAEEEEVVMGGEKRELQKDSSEEEESSEDEKSNKRRKNKRRSKKSKTDIGNGILKFKGM